MLSRITLHAGTSPGSPQLAFQPGAVTLFIGPNNSGKSQALRDIAELLRNRGPRQPVVASVHLRQFASAPDLIAEFRKLSHNDDGEHLSLVIRLGGTSFPKLNISQIERNFAKADWVYTNLGPATAIALDGRTRLSLLDQQKLQDLQGPPHSHLGALFRDDAARAELRKLAAEAFGLYAAIDPTRPGWVRVTLSKTPPPSPEVERGLGDAAVKFHSDATAIESFSDGVKAYVGLLCAVLAARFGIMLIDEPEAFLHPSLARTLGNRLSGLATKRDASVVAATHSSDFLMGCIESGTPVQIVRLTYTNELATARLLDSKTLTPLMRDPLLRSADVLSGLFHDGVCVGESDTDRSFYQEINYRLLSSGDKGARNTKFLNAQNKQTVRRVIRPLRLMGVAAAAIVDIDVVKEGGKDWSRLLEAAQVPAPLRAPWGTIRAQVANALKATGKNMKRDGGIGLLNGANAKAANELFDSLARYGIFVVRGGEIETWLAYLGAAGHGADWLIKVFTAMKADPSAPDYVTPGAGDVWDFMRGLARWIADPNREGVA